MWSSSCEWWWWWLSCRYCSLTHYLRSRDDHVSTNCKCQGEFGKQQEKMRGSWLRSHTPLMVLDRTWAKQDANSKGSEPNRREAQEKRREIKDNFETLGGTKLTVWVRWLIHTSVTCYVLSWERMPYMTLSSRIEFNSYSQMCSRWIDNRVMLPNKMVYKNSTYMLC